MDQCLERIVSDYSTSEILHVCRTINKDYNIYDPEKVRWDKISYALYKTPLEEIEGLKQITFSNKVVNDLIFHFYFCERVIKYHFIKYLKTRHDNIVAFEMTVGESRVDICRINGSSYAYEIKTEYDTFDRLETQMRDYLKTFEKVYVIVPKSRSDDVKRFVPDSCGIIAYKVTEDCNISFSYARKAIKNKCDLTTCLGSLSSSDLSYLLKLIKLKDCSTKSKKLESIMLYTANHSIWPCYRQLLRHKYEEQWKFITQHFDEILPLDIQHFFSSNLNPQILYGK